MDIKLLIKQQIKKLQTILDQTELFLGEIIFNNNG
jgi:hypothetical protein